MEASHPEWKEVDTKTLHCLHATLSLYLDRCQARSQYLMALDPSYLRCTGQSKVFAEASKMYNDVSIRLLDGDQLITIKWNEPLD